MSPRNTNLALVVIGMIAIIALVSGPDTRSLNLRISELEAKLALVTDGEASISVSGTVFANKFIMVDKDGNGRAEVGYGPGGNGNFGPGFWVYDIYDNDKLSLGLFQDASHRTRLDLYNAEDQRQAAFSFMANENPGTGTAVFKRETIIQDFEYGQ